MAISSLCTIDSDKSSLTRRQDVIGYLVDTVAQLKSDNAALTATILTLSDEVKILHLSVENLRLNYGDI